MCLSSCRPTLPPVHRHPHTHTHTYMASTQVRMNMHMSTSRHRFHLLTYPHHRHARQQKTRCSLTIIVWCVLFTSWGRQWGPGMGTHDGVDVNIVLGHPVEDLERRGHVPGCGAGGDQRAASAGVWPQPCLGRGSPCAWHPRTYMEAGGTWTKWAGKIHCKICAKYAKHALLKHA